ncbi:MAG: hypothetical protein M3P22_02110 [bacterium]|nr:hypothetical protein [bacterium]
MKDKKENNMNIWRPIGMFYVKTIGWVAVPALVAFFASSYLKMSQTNFFITIVIAFLITIYGIYKEIKDYKKTLYKENKEK